jgi:hypothetical protein
MTHGNKKWVKMMHKYYTTNMKPNKCIKVSLMANIEKYGKVLNLAGFGPHPLGK